MLMNKPYSSLLPTLMYLIMHTCTYVYVQTQAVNHNQGLITINETTVKVSFFSDYTNI